MKNRLGSDYLIPRFARIRGITKSIYLMMSNAVEIGDTILL